MVLDLTVINRRGAGALNPPVKSLIGPTYIAGSSGCARLVDTRWQDKTPAGTYPERERYREEREGGREEGREGEIEREREREEREREGRDGGREGERK